MIKCTQHNNAYYRLVQHSIYIYKDCSKMKHKFMLANGFDYSHINYYLHLSLYTVYPVQHILYSHMKFETALVCLTSRLSSQFSSLVIDIEIRRSKRMLYIEREIRIRTYRLVYALLFKLFLYLDLNIFMAEFCFQLKSLLADMPDLSQLLDG